MNEWALISTLEATGNKKAEFTPALIKYLHSGSEQTACDAARLLASIGPDARAAIPPLLAQLPVGGWAFSNAVADALWKMDRRTNVVLGILTEQICALPNDMRVAPLSRLQEMGSAAKPAAPLVLQVLQTSSDPVRSAAADTLRQIDPVLFESAIRDFNQNARNNIENLVKTIREVPQQRYAAMNVLAVYGADAKPAVPALVEILHTLKAPSTNLLGNLARQFAVGCDANALAEIGPEARTAVPLLIFFLTRSQRHYMSTREVCTALGNIGPDAAAALPALEDVLHSGLPGSQLAAATAIIRIDPHPKNEVAIILEGLTNYASPVSENGVVKYPKPGDPAFEINPSITLPAKIALWKLGLIKNPPVEEVMAQHDQFSFTMIPLLGEMGPAARSSLPFLKGLLNSSQSSECRREAAIAIRKIDPKEAEKLGLPGILGLLSQ